MPPAITLGVRLLNVFAMRLGAAADIAVGTQGRQFAPCSRSLFLYRNFSFDPRDQKQDRHTASRTLSFDTALPFTAEEISVACGLPELVSVFPRRLLHRRRCCIKRNGAGPANITGSLWASSGSYKAKRRTHPLLHDPRESWSTTTRARLTRRTHHARRTT